MDAFAFIDDILAPFATVEVPDHDAPSESVPTDFERSGSGGYGWCVIT
jgi:hypothetical protein